ALMRRSGVPLPRVEEGENSEPVLPPFPLFLYILFSPPALPPAAPWNKTASPSARLQLRGVERRYCFPGHGSPTPKCRGRPVAGRGEKEVSRDAPTFLLSAPLLPAGRPPKQAACGFLA